MGRSAQATEGKDQGKRDLGPCPHIQVPKDESRDDSTHAVRKYGDTRGDQRQPSDPILTLADPLGLVPGT